MPDVGKGPAGHVGSAWAPRSAVLMIVAGIVLAGAGFVVDPLGELSDSVRLGVWLRAAVDVDLLFIYYIYCNCICVRLMILLFIALLRLRAVM